jgi:hypothetical protein
MPGELIRSTAVALVRGRVRIKEYGDGTVRIQVICPGQMVMTECYLAGSPIMITLAPRPK